MNNSIPQEFVFDRDLVQLHARYESKEDLINSLGSLIESKQYAKEGYRESLLKREIEYPTGINMGTIGIAIPHTDKNLVNINTIAVAVLEEGIAFEDMGGSDEVIHAEIVMVLVMKEPKMHNSFLKKLIVMLQEQEVVERFRNATDPADIEEMLKQLI